MTAIIVVPNSKKNMLAYELFNILHTQKKRQSEENEVFLNNLNQIFSFFY